MWSEFFQREDLSAILPQVQLTVFACGILLMDFLLEQRHKYMNAVTALLGIGFSGFAVWQLRDTVRPAFGGMLAALPEAVRDKIGFRTQP
ncbi:MAG: hypothetical protein L0099_15940 [Acidobacteria bacterium]|nr:hypothetical protein [Acidobacteriota bacterium]